MRKSKFKIKIKTLKDEILQNLCDNLREVFDSEFKTFKSKCEGLVNTRASGTTKK